MHLCKMDAYYHLATQGDTEAFKVLYKEFSLKAKIQTYTCINSSPNYAGNPDDFWFYIDKIFFKMLNEFEQEKGRFSTFLEYVITKRIGAFISTQLAEDASKNAYFFEDKEGNFGIENMADPNQLPMSTDIAIKRFKYRISSKNRNRSNIDRVNDKILLLQYCGYTNQEICKHLNLTYSQLRTYCRNMKKDQKLVNFKLELK